MQSRKDFIGKMDDCKKMLKDNTQWNKLPVVNYTPNNLLFHDQLVVYRGMVQDMLNPVLYLAQYEVKNSDTGESSIRHGEFTDSLDCKENEETVLDSSSTVYKERRAIYCVTVPGSNEWVEKPIRERNAEIISNLLSSSSSSSSSAHIPESKRVLDADEKMEEDCNETAEGNTSNKRICTRKAPEVEENDKNTKCDYNLPITERSKDILHPAVLLNIYDEDLKLQINDIIEIAGFISCDPTVLHGASDVADEEFPPPSLVPRIHAVDVRIVQNCCNPLAGIDDSEDVLRCAETTRAELHSILTKILLGDNLAADYLLLHLLSSVFQRKDALVLGKYCLNMSNLPKGSQYAKSLYTFLTNLVPTSHYISMTLENLNTLKFIPKKNYETSRLESGVLQLSKNTQLVLDETTMDAGKLNDRGVRNVQALAGLINFQKVDYDFHYYPVEFPMNTRVLVLSEGKSMLPSDFHISLDYPDTNPEYLDELFLEASRFVDRQSLTAQLRVYLTTVANLAYEFSDDIEMQITEDFVKMRRERQKTSSQDLHNLLVLARLFSLSRGCTVLTKETWEIVQDMEEQRRLRMEKR